MSSPWRAAARAVKRALLGTGTRVLDGKTYRLSYEARWVREDRDFALLGELAQGKRCVFDVGANMGVTALLMASRLAADGELFAFDASEEACRILRENAVLNGLESRIRPIQAVVSGRSGRAVAFHGEHASGGASTISGYLGHHDALFKATLSLDDFRHELARPVELVKIDVEGAEAEALAGARGLMRDDRPLFVVELHSWHGCELPQNAARLLELLRDPPYRMIYLRTRDAIEDPSLLAGRGRCHVLLIPARTPLPEGLDRVDTSCL